MSKISQNIIYAIRGRSDLQEAAGAYKNIEEVMANQTDLVRIRTALSAIAVIKGQLLFRSVPLFEL